MQAPEHQRYIRVPVRDQEHLEDGNNDALIATELIDVCIPIKQGGTRIFLRRTETPMFIDTSYAVHEIISAIKSRVI